MHTSAHFETGTHFRYNSDLSGGVVISVDVSAASLSPHARAEISVPGAALLDFILQYLARREISNIEVLTTEGLIARYAGTGATR